MSTPRAANSAANQLAILDFLFTFSLASGLVPEVFEIPHIHGLLSEPWLTGPNPQFPNLQEFGHLVTVIFGVSTLTLSWQGYHWAVEQRPHKTERWEGVMRFQLDVLLIILYGLLLLVYRDTRWAITVGATVYMIYALWDWLEDREYRGDPSRTDETIRGHKVTYFWACCFVGLAIVTWLVGRPAAVMAGVAILFNVLYRLNKIRPLWTDRVFDRRPA